MFSSYDLARNCEIVYSEVLSKSQFENLDSNNLKILSNDDNLVFYKLLNFQVADNDTIFTHTGNLLNLFMLLKKLDKDLNLTLITHQSDREIDKKLFDKKPKCVNKWFAINVNYNNENLIPMPLGLANEIWNDKNITLKKIKQVNIERFFCDKSTLLYLNFTNSTNQKEREWLKPYFQKFEWAQIEYESLSLDDYISKIKSSSFVLCPWGNGFDSHRIWETISLGSIPIVKKHITFEQYKNLPILFVDDFTEISEELLLNFLKSDCSKFSLEEIYLSFWISKITPKTSNSGRIYKISEPKSKTILFSIKSKTISKLNGYLKIFRFYLKKLKKLRYVFNKN